MWSDGSGAAGPVSGGIAAILKYCQDSRLEDGWLGIFRWPNLGITGRQHGTRLYN